MRVTNARFWRAEGPFRNPEQTCVLRKLADRWIRHQMPRASPAVWVPGCAGDPNEHDKRADRGGGDRPGVHAAEAPLEGIDSSQKACGVEATR